MDRLEHSIARLEREHEQNPMLAWTYIQKGELLIASSDAAVTDPVIVSVDRFNSMDNSFDLEWVYHISRDTYVKRKELYEFPKNIYRYPYTSEINQLKSNIDYISDIA